MKKVLVILSLGLGVAGCATMLDSQVSPSAERKAALVTCVSRFLSEDVSPVDSMNICGQVFSRWEPTTTKGFNLEAKGE